MWLMPHGAVPPQHAAQAHPPHPLHDAVRAALQAAAAQAQLLAGALRKWPLMHVAPPQPLRNPHQRDGDAADGHGATPAAKPAALGAEGDGDGDAEAAAAAEFEADLWSGAVMVAHKRCVVQGRAPVPTGLVVDGFLRSDPRRSAPKLSPPLSFLASGGGAGRWRKPCYTAPPHTGA